MPGKQKSDRLETQRRGTVCMLEFLSQCSFDEMRAFDGGIYARTFEPDISTDQFHIIPKVTMLCM